MFRVLKNQVGERAGITLDSRIIYGRVAYVDQELLILEKENGLDEPSAKHFVYIPLIEIKMVETSTANLKTKENGNAIEDNDENEKDDKDTKKATQKQLNAIFAIGYNNGLSKEEILAEIEKKFGTTNIVDNVSRRDVSDYIQEIQDDTQDGLPF